MYFAAQEINKSETQSVVQPIPDSNTSFKAIKSKVVEILSHLKARLLMSTVYLPGLWHISLKLNICCDQTAQVAEHRVVVQLVGGCTWQVTCTWRASRDGSGVGQLLDKMVQLVGSCWWKSFKASADT